MTTAAKPRRVPADERRQLVLEAAAQVFFESGFEGASIDAVIKRVGGSKRDIYNAFGNKEGLFAAIVHDNADDVMGELADGVVPDTGLRESLIDFARRGLGLLYSQKSVALYRTVVAEGMRFPDLARVFYEAGPMRAAAGAVAILDAAVARGELPKIDSKRAADHFIGMLRDNRQLAVILGLVPTPGKAAIEAHAKSAVSIFLDGIGRHG